VASAQAAAPGATREAAAALQGAAGIESTLDWAEWKYPGLFTKGAASYSLSYLGAGYTVRSYATGNNLGITADGTIWGLGPLTNQVLTSFGNVADFAAQVQADACSVYPGSCAPVQPLTGSMLFETGATVSTGTGSDSASNSRTATMGQLTQLSVQGGTASTVTPLQTAGTWFPQASFKEADINLAAGVLRNLRERYRLYLQGGRLVRVDVAATAAITPQRVSTLAQSDLCFGSYFAQAFDDWTQPANSWIAYRVRPRCNESRVFDDFPDRRYVAVRVGMGSGDAPIDLGALQPLLAIRDRAGAITGFIAFDGTTLVRTDASFGARITLATMAEPRDDQLEALGVFGTDAAPYLLYVYRPWSAPVEYRTVPLVGGASRKLFTAVGVTASFTADSDAVYLSFMPSLTDGETLVRSGHDGSLITLASRLPGGGSSRLRLTPTRVIHEADGALTSVAKGGGGTRETYTAPGLGVRSMAVVGEAVYLYSESVSIGGGNAGPGVLILNSTLESAPGAIVELGLTRLLGELLPQQIPLVRRGSVEPAFEQVMLMRELSTSSGFNAKDATLGAYGAARSPVVTIGVLDMVGQGNENVGGLREVPGFEARWLGPDFSGGGRYWSALMVGQPALLSFDLGPTVLVPGTPSAGVGITRIAGP